MQNEILNIQNEYSFILILNCIDDFDIKYLHKPIRSI